MYSDSHDFRMPQCDHVKPVHVCPWISALQGYDVSGHAYVLRVISLLIGMGICMAVFYKNQKNRPYRRTFLDLFREFDVRSARTGGILS